MIRVLIVDDHQIVIDGIKSLLAAAEDIDCTGEANAGEEALERCVNTHFDVVLLDISMPGMDGLLACEQIRKNHPRTRVIALTMLSEGAMIKAMINKGASGYLLKNVGYQELVTAIRRVHAGKTHYSAEIADILLRPRQTSTRSGAEFPTLSRREKQILKYIIDENTTSEIAGILHISHHTVDTHRRNLMHKLGVRNTAGLVRIALQYNLVDL